MPLCDEEISIKNIIFNIERSPRHILGRFSLESNLLVVYRWWFAVPTIRHCEQQQYERNSVVPLHDRTFSYKSTANSRNKKKIIVRLRMRCCVGDVHIWVQNRECLVLFCSILCVDISIAIISFERIISCFAKMPFECIIQIDTISTRISVCQQSTQYTL